MFVEDHVRSAHDALSERRLMDYVASIKAIDFREREVAWTALGKEHGKSIDLVGLMLSWPDEDKRSAFTYLAPAVAHVAGLKASEMLALLQLAATVPQADGYYFHKALVQLFKADLAAAIEVGDRLREDASSASDRRWELWAGSISQANTPAAAKYACDLPIESPDERLRLALLVERLQAADPAVAELLKSRADEFGQALLKEAPTEGTHYSAHWSALCRVAEFSSVAMQAVLDAAQRGERPALIALSNWLHGRASDVVGASRTPLAHILDLLVEKSLVDEELRTRAADGAIESLLYNQNLRELVLPCLERLGTVNAPVAEVFDAAFGALNEYPGAPERLLTAWLVSPDAAFSAIQSMLHRFSGPRRTIGLDAPNLHGRTP